MTGPGKEPVGWKCVRCGIGLQYAKVQVAYLGSVFTIDLPACPRCGLALVSEEIALTKLAEAERLLEDK